MLESDLALCLGRAQPRGTLSPGGMCIVHESSKLFFVVLRLPVPGCLVVTAFFIFLLSAYGLWIMDGMTLRSLSQVVSQTASFVYKM